MQNFLEQQIANLNCIRAAFSGLFETLKCRSMNETRQFQSVFMLFLVQLIDALGLRYDVKVANGIKLEGKLHVDDMIKNMTGHTDVFVVDPVLKTETDPPTLNRLIDGSLVLYVELKSPFGALYQSPAAAAEDQLLAESEAISQMEAGRFVAGILTDSFAISISIRCGAEKGSGGHAEHFLAPRVVDAEKYLLRLLLLLCPNEEVLSLLPPRDSAIPLPDDEDGPIGDANDLMVRLEISEQEEAQADCEKRQSEKLSSTWKRGQKIDREQTAEEEEEERAESLSLLHSWDSRRRGFAPLTLSELRKRNVRRVATEPMEL
jgi:hypothetical protein